MIVEAKVEICSKNRHNKRAFWANSKFQDPAGWKYFFFDRHWIFISWRFIWGNLTNPFLRILHLTKV
jgi:hypothetical protein